MDGEQKVCPPFQRLLRLDVTHSGSHQRANIITTTSNILPTGARRMFKYSTLGRLGMPQ